MMTKCDHINFWLEQANDDWAAVGTLFVGRNYLQSLFFAHLVIEKVCKSLWIMHNQDNVPPRTHNLMQLLAATPIILGEDRSEFILKLNRFQLEGRYPDYFTKMRVICDEQFTISILSAADELRQWLLKKLQ
jgi:HEPN domain-containing protein